MHRLVVVCFAFLAVASAKPSLRKTHPFLGLRNQLGENAYGAKIVGGRDAEEGEFPWQISLQVDIGDWAHNCGGSVIDKNWVLTAGHCCQGFPSSLMRIQAGVTELDDEGQVSGIKNMIVHPDFRGGVAPHDLCLLELKTSLTLNENVQPIELAKQGSAPQRGNSTISGWGYLYTGSEAPNHLQAVVIPIITFKACEEALIKLFGSSEPLVESNVCTGPLTGGHSPCQGDSGGPLYVEENGEPVQVGVVSWGIVPCASEGAPNVYASVSNYRDWIAKNSGI